MCVYVSIKTIKKNKNKIPIVVTWLLLFKNSSLTVIADTSSNDIVWTLRGSEKASLHCSVIFSLLTAYSFCSSFSFSLSIVSHKLLDTAVLKEAGTASATVLRIIAVFCSAVSIVVFVGFLKNVSETSSFCSCEHSHEKSVSLEIILFTIFANISPTLAKPCSIPEKKVAS